MLAAHRVPSASGCWQSWGRRRHAPLALCRRRGLETHAWKGWKAPGLCKQHPGAAAFCCRTWHGQEKAPGRARATADHAARWGYKQWGPDTPAPVSGGERCRLTREGDQLGMKNPLLGFGSCSTLGGAGLGSAWELGELRILPSRGRRGLHGGNNIPNGAKKNQRRGEGILKGCGSVLTRQRIPNLSSLGPQGSCGTFTLGDFPPMGPGKRPVLLQPKPPYPKRRQGQSSPAS